MKPHVFAEDNSNRTQFLALLQNDNLQITNIWYAHYSFITNHLYTNMRLWGWRKVSTFALEIKTHSIHKQKKKGQ